MEKILVPSDYSKEAHHALLFAMKVAQQTQAQITLFHAFNQPVLAADDYSVEEAIDDLEKEQTRLLENYAQEVRSHWNQNTELKFHSSIATGTKEKGISNLTKIEFYTRDSETVKSDLDIHCICKFGLAAENILVATEECGVTLVIMGMRGAGPVKQALLGSTVANVIRAGKVPVLALPLGAEIKNLPTFVFAIELPAIPHYTVLSWLRLWVKLFQAHLKILHVIQDETQQREENNSIALKVLDTQLYDIAFNVYFLREEEIARGIQEFIQKRQVDLLVLVPKHHDFLEILLQDTITGFMIKQSLIPLLTIPDYAVTE